MSFKLERRQYAVESKLMTIKELVVLFRVRQQVLTAIREASLDVFRGEILCIVGESGSGKSVLVKSLLGLLDDNGWVDSGVICYKNYNLARFKSEKQWSKIRGRELAMVFQDPMTSLNPLRTIGLQIQETVELHQGLFGKAAKRAVWEILDSVGISQPQKRYNQYPFQFSGGMRQRVVFGIALACKPKILICDEPTTALDVTVQAQLLQLLLKLQRQHNLTIIFITHDLGVVAGIADRVAVMYAGDIIEVGMTEEIFFNPKHPYTVSLLCSLPQAGEKGNPLHTIKGSPPNLFENIAGDAFAPRNPKALKIDFVRRPPFFQVSSTHKAKTWLLDPRAPKLDIAAPVRKLHAQWGEKDGR